MTRTTVIVEPGCTHERRLADLLELVDVAARAGADIFKAQWMSDPEEVCRRRNAPDYLRFYRWLQFPAAWHETLTRRCRANGIAYACTVYTPSDVVRLGHEAPDVAFYKLSAFEAQSLDMLDTIYAQMERNERPLIVSLGMGAVAPTLPPSLTGRLVKLRCVSAYPTAIHDLCLATLRDGDADGLSDHTAGDDVDSLFVGGLAVAAGARWIERHIRLETCRLNNPDFGVSLSEFQLQAYVHNIRLAERAIGKTTNDARHSERPMMRYRAWGPPPSAA